MIEDRPVCVAIIGMGGFARSHHHAVYELERQGACKLVATCDPQPAVAAALAADLDFGNRQVRAYGSYQQMLEECADLLDVVTIPTPLPLHAEMHAACVERGLAVYLEKPPTLDIAELERMLAVEARAQKLTNVGFNYIIEQPRRRLKQRLLSGELGALKRACFHGLWPRATSYFRRTYWAGKLVYVTRSARDEAPSAPCCGRAAASLDGRLVLDSCMGNAMAHYVHNVLHWAGLGGMDCWASPARVEAELYRAHDIESFDTVFARATTADGIELRFALSHASAGEERQAETVVCERATISYDIRSGWRLQHADGREEHGDTGNSGLLAANLASYFAYVNGRAERPVTRLEDSRAFVELCDLTLVAAGHIQPVREPLATRVKEPDGGEYVVIGEKPDELDLAAKAMIAEGALPSERGFAWAAPGGSATRAGLRELPAVVRRMVERAGAQ
ncbi:MAG: Gfo/Idh/MocA family protein [Armatimonadota bacterium]